MLYDTNITNVVFMLKLYKINYFIIRCLRYEKNSHKKIKPDFFANQFFFLKYLYVEQIVGLEKVTVIEPLFLLKKKKIQRRYFWYKI